MKAARRATGRAINSVLGRVGLELRRKAARPQYYPQVDSCQIGHLDFLYSLFLGQRAEGYFVEVGAFDGHSFSNTWGLAERGWGGILIEPVPEFAAACRRRHRNHPGVRTLELAIGDASGVELRINLADALTTANPEQLAEYAQASWSRGVLTERSIAVPSTTLDAVLDAERAPQDFDVLVVDVEGLEPAVFRGFTVAEWTPKLMIVEILDTHPDLRATRRQDHDLAQQILGGGYGIVYKDEINTVFVRSDVIRAAYGR